MSFEKIRVGARVMLVGRAGIGNLLVAFSVCLRVAVYSLAVLVFLHSDTLYSNKDGRVILALCTVAVLSAVLLLWCTRTVKDRWFAALSDGSYVSVTELIIDFSLRDILHSVRCGLLSLALSLVRLVAFGAIPSAFAVLLFIVMRDGVSRAVFFVMLAGFIAVAACSVFFLCVSLGCVSLARSLCLNTSDNLFCFLNLLEKNCFALFRFSLFLSNTNRCSRRFAKIVFARLVTAADTPFCNL